MPHAGPHSLDELDILTIFGAVEIRPITGPEVLEARIAPAVFHWAGDRDGNWNDPANWYNETTQTLGDGYPNSFVDTAKFVDVLNAKHAVRIPDGVTISVGSIFFDDDFGYKIVEGASAKLLLGPDGTITVAPGSTGDHGIFAPVQLLGGVTITNDSATTLTMFGAISGLGGANGVLKAGTGVVQFSGSVANSYAGNTTVLAGTLELAKTNSVAIPGPLLIGDPVQNLPATVRLLNHEQIATQRLTLYSTGELDMQGFEETVSRLTLYSGDASGSHITMSSSGRLYIDDITLNKGNTGAVGASITGVVMINSSASGHLAIADGAAGIDLLITGTLIDSGNGKLTKEGLGRLHLDGSYTTQGGLDILKGALTVQGGGEGTVQTLDPTARIAGNWIVGNLDIQMGTLAPGLDGPGSFASAQGSLILREQGKLEIQLNGRGEVLEYDQISVNGSVQLAGQLSLSVGFTPVNGDVFTIIRNNGQAPVQGILNGIGEGGVIRSGDHFFRISYVGGDGNDVTLEALVPEVKIASNGKSATYTDVDGDQVTIKTTKGSFEAGDFKFLPTGNAFAGQQLSLINLSDDNGEFANANITITAKRGPLGGNGLVNVGFIDATGTKLGKVSVSGDLGRIKVGDGAGLALKSLAVGSMGAFNLLTQEPDSDLNSVISGSLGALVVKGDVRAASLLATAEAAADGAIGSVIIGGSLLGAAETNSGTIRADHNIGKIKIRGSIVGFGEGAGAIVSSAGNINSVTLGGSLVGGPSNFSGSIRAPLGKIDSVAIAGDIRTSGAFFGNQSPTGDGSILAGTTLGAVTVRGDVVGYDLNPVVISATGGTGTLVKGVDLAIKSITVTGNLEATRILAGYDAAGVGKNADASIGSITVGGNWISSSLLAGVSAGADLFEGTSDDTKLTGENIRDEAKPFSQIASVVIKGQAYAFGGSYGIVAEEIKSARIGGAKLPIDPLPHNDFFPIGVTGPGPSGEVSNMTLLEVLPQPA